MDQVARDEVTSWRVPAHLTDIRLDSFARRCLPHISRKVIEEAIREKLFLINGRVAEKGQRLGAGDVLLFDGPEQWLAAQPLPDFQIDVPIVYEDSTILLLNKPAGVATHGFSARDTTTLANFLLAKWPDLVKIGKSRWEPGLVHRLDRDTSGLVMIAKTQTAFDRLRLQLRRRQIIKKYLALVWGKTTTEGTIEVSLTHDPRDPRRMQPVGNSSGRKKQKTWRAVTHFRKLAETDKVSLLEIEMRTGVTHQIRVHVATLGHAIVGDALYGTNSTQMFDFERHFLHASSLEFCHPDDGRIVRLNAELPNDLRAVLKRLELTV